MEFGVVKMALEVQWETPYGITCNNAYVIVHDAHIEKKTEDYDDEGTLIERTHFVIRFKVKVWSDLTAYNDKKSFIGGQNFQFELDTDDTDADQFNPIQQCYEHIKTLPGIWENTIDC